MPRRVKYRAGTAQGSVLRFYSFYFLGGLRYRLFFVFLVCFLFSVLPRLTHFLLPVYGCWDMVDEVVARRPIYIYIYIYVLCIAPCFVFV